MSCDGNVHIGMIVGNDKEDSSTTKEIHSPRSQEPSITRKERKRIEKELKRVEEERKKAEEEELKRVEEEKCRQDIQCWGDKHSIAVSVWCSDTVESYAQYDHEWTDSWYETKFDQFGWADKKSGTIQYHGNKIKFQNGFGAWQPMEYAVIYDPQAETCRGWYVRPRN